MADDTTDPTAPEPQDQPDFRPDPPAAARPKRKKPLEEYNTTMLGVIALAVVVMLVGALLFVKLLGFGYTHYTAEFAQAASRSEEHTSELQSRGHLVCRLLLANKKDK